jgi:hypothetical protein
MTDCPVCQQRAMEAQQRQLHDTQKAILSGSTSFWCSARSCTSCSAGCMFAGENKKPEDWWQLKRFRQPYLNDHVTLCEERAN